ncbi:hypothetical protein [Pleionea sp. CnH1-48]|uniref:hypothetical protein n=1 Tax=Pleionea sp. CnH1-48 TaxID=2954494 RepID=UPI002097AB59|nr:hypothetical protein [Pleionea sp. CnH1-48]MCO7224372.1 hypothetical protein [Pleionea sp. CnH1-48]
MMKKTLVGGSLKAKNSEISLDFESFFRKFHSLTKKYQILTPVVDFYLEKLNIKDAFEHLNNGYLATGEFNLLDLYKGPFIKDRAFPSTLFVKNKGKIEKKNIVDAPRLIEVEDIGNESYSYFEEPLCLLHTKDCMALYIKSDVFLQEFWNKKLKYSSNSELHTHYVDNSDLAYLNTPRFNSFLRDFKKLMRSYGGTFSTDLLTEYTSESGILLGNEVVYYEDIVELIDKSHQVVELSIDTDFIIPEKYQGASEYPVGKKHQNRTATDQTPLKWSELTSILDALQTASGQSHGIKSLKTLIAKMEREPLLVDKGGEHISTSSIDELQQLINIYDKNLRLKDMLS